MRHGENVIYTTQEFVVTNSSLKPRNRPMTKPPGFIVPRGEWNWEGGGGAVEAYSIQNM